jgi:DNA modification methylase
MIINQERGNGFLALHGDCVQAIAQLPAQSIDYSIFSPPFASLYTYSDSEMDMGNCKTHKEFFEHFDFLVIELSRVMKPGRLISFHCMNLPTSKERDGYIGITDFRGELIRAFQRQGFVFHSEVCIWKDPVTAMQRTKALGLLHKQVIKDSSMSRQGIADYLVTMRMPGQNLEPIAGAFDRYVGTDEPKDPFTTSGDNRNPYSINVWQRYASPVWMDINPSRTLQYTTAREENDERHICPLQLDVIERGVQLWSNPGDVVLSPFLGIGSEGHVALLTGRRFVGIELKKSYFDIAVKNLRDAEMTHGQMLFPDVALFG